jgi:general secretion pathway protein D
VTATNAAADISPPSGISVVSEGGTNCLRLNFREASLDSVLDYLSEAAGFVIVREARTIAGKVNMVSYQPITKEEALDLLDSELNRNGYAAIRKGRTLKIVNKDEAKTKALPVVLESDPDKIPDNDEMVTQIIPVRFVEVAQLIKDLQPLVSTQTAMTANESGNSIVITDTQCNIRRVAEIIKAIDTGAEDVTVVRIFHLKNANPTETVDLLSNLFPDESRSGSGGGSQAPMQFGGFGGFRRMFGGGGGGPFGGGGGNNAGGSGQNARIKKRARVIAVADSRTSSLIVTASKDLMDQIEQVVTDLDGSQANLKTVSLFKLDSAEPNDVLQVMQDIFNKNTTQTSRNNRNQNDALTTRSTQQNQYSTSQRTSTTGGGRTGGMGGMGN